MTTYVKEYALAETKRHKPCLIYRGYRYVQDKIQNRTVYWRCEDRSHCNGRAHQLLNNDSLPILTIKHNHTPLVEDLSRHDIISVDSHRRRRRQRQRRVISTPTNDQTMTSTIKLENNSNKHHQQRAAMMKNLHLSEVIRTTTSAHFHPYSPLTTNGQPSMNSIEMSKLLNNIASISNRSISKSNGTPSTSDFPSRLNHFSWEEIEGRYVPVIYRNENGISQRYTSKMYVENTLFQSESWQRHLTLARSLPPLVSYSYTEHELNLFRTIISWHLAGFYFKTIPSTDCLIRFEDLWEFYTTLRKLRDTITTTSSFNRPIAPVPSSSKPNLQPQSLEMSIPSKVDKSTMKESGWVQINNVFVPYIIKMKIRDNISSREFFIPYEILIKCNIFSDAEFPLKKCLIKATQQDFDLLNHLITNINIFDEKVPEKTLLVNLYHVMIGLNRILYIKFLPTKQPRTQVNRYHAEVLTHKGGTLLMNGNKYIPYVVQNNRFYVPLIYTFHSLPNFLLQAKRNARAPRQYEIDYLNLLFIYFSIDNPPLTSDTLLVDIFNIKCSNLQTPAHFRTLHEHQQFERNRLLSALAARPTSNSKSSTGTSSTSKSSKCPPPSVVVNPMIHHPSFYGLPTSNPLLTSVKAAEIKVISFNNRLLNAIVKSTDLSKNDWKISIREIFQQFAFEIDYRKFLQWTQTNLLLSLIKLDDEEKKLISHHQQHDDDDYYIHQRNLERCFALLNDLQRGTISMTLLPTTTTNSDATSKSPLAGAKKRKMAVPTTHHTPPISTMVETNSIPEIIPSDLAMIEQPAKSIPMEISNDLQDTCPIVDDNDNDDDDDAMPIVASVEEEQPIIDETMSSTFVIVESADGSDERIQLDDIIPSDCISSMVSNPSHETDEKHGNEEIQTIVSSHSSPVIPRKKSMKKRQRNGYVKPRSRVRSSTPRIIKRTRPLDDEKPVVDENNTLVVIITSEKIEQHLRTLFMATNDNKRTRTRPVKTPTRLVEELNPNSMKILESDSNVFDILSSSTSTTNDQGEQLESTENSSQPCTYNIVATTKSNKLGLTIKKVVQT